MTSSLWAGPARLLTQIKRETAWPHSFGCMYLGALKEQTDEDHALNQLKAMCRGRYDTDGGAGALYSTCAEAIVAIEDEFRAFVSVAK
ncbi:hypothetical protein EVC45_10570 [Paraburkholderia sp. UYCP14C]|uniref:hypothetical protein n=1 Tax=Paraburkholderia sp. UYCP14C TaxID=2511130 RepID=UPI00101FEBEE|nr:hypothetical protein [Paraburkholderia sp. UYCP14C]RZF29633.1 hypothetical protein EVC45_10570 [Paraburkholderia sp. UYCP14C]